MECKLNLYHRGQTDEIVLHQETDSNTGIFEMAETVNLLAEDRYQCSVTILRADRQINGIELLINEDCVGSSDLPVYISDHKQKFNISLKDDFENGGKQIFLLYYDLVKLYVKVQFTDKSYVSFTSDYLLCCSKNMVSSENAEELIKYLVEFNDETINEWMFSHKGSISKENIFEDGLQQKSAYQSLQAYIQLLTSIYISYKDTYPIFKSNVRHKIVKHNALQPFEKIRSINASGLQWLFQNIGQLVEVVDNTAVKLNGKNYLPFQMSVEKSINNFDIYENRVVSGFLLLVCKHAKHIEEQLRQNIRDENKIIEKLRDLEQEGLYAPIIAVKQIQLTNIKKMLDELRALILDIASQHREYAKIDIHSDYPITSSPKKTKIFQEVRPYLIVFEQIMKWFKFGDFSLVKENLIFNVKTMDKLFEYYCLCQLLTALKKHGFSGTDRQFPSLLYRYKNEANESYVANTYFLKRDNVYVTLYYQPVIRTDYFENGITLFRTTSRNNYYTPDFLLKIRYKEYPAVYLIFDAKYSTRNTIKNYYFDKTIIQYACELSDTRGQSVKMVWLLQGRVDDSEYLEKYHISPLAQKYKPAISYGIASINTKNDAMEKLWDEISPYITGVAKGN